MPVQRYSVIRNGEVVNTILVDDESQDFVLGTEEGDLVLAPQEVSIGWKQEGTEWVAPPVPERVSDPAEDPVVIEAKNTAVEQLMALGITEPVARTIAGLPPLE